KGNDQLHSQAVEEVKALSRSLEGGDSKDAVAKLLAAVTKQRQRDLVIRLSWDGDTDLDLKVKEPNGSVCSCLNRQTIGGGTLVGDTLAAKSEVYYAAQAFTGEYEVTVDRVWGQPVGGKCKLEVIQHQGTPQQTTHLVTLDLKS